MLLVSVFCFYLMWISFGFIYLSHIYLSCIKQNNRNNDNNNTTNGNNHNKIFYGNYDNFFRATILWNTCQCLHLFIEKGNPSVIKLKKAIKFDSSMFVFYSSKFVLGKIFQTTFGQNTPGKFALNTCPIGTPFRLFLNFVYESVVSCFNLIFFKKTFHTFLTYPRRR